MFYLLLLTFMDTALEKIWINEIIFKRFWEKKIFYCDNSETENIIIVFINTQDYFPPFDALFSLDFWKNITYRFTSSSTTNSP